MYRQLYIFDGDNMRLNDKILAWARSRKSFTTAELFPVLGLSRQTVSEHLARLVREGVLTRSGSTRGARYSTGQPARMEQKRRTLIRALKNLNEDRVFREVEAATDLKRSVNHNAYQIVSYAFMEMLNNAIEHSRSKTARIDLKVSEREIEFCVRDHGIGAFYNVMKTYHLDSEFVALEHTFKGKQTTDPKRHSGEGIFFTSRVADIFVLRSHRLETTVDNVKDDFFLRERRFLRGTEVVFRLKKQTKRKLGEVFSQYTNEEYQFDKNRIRVKISRYSGALSRSQARRLVMGLEKFREIDFDFSDVDEIGQGFADELFRVFKENHPEITLTFSNANPAVAFMIGRATATESSGSGTLMP